MATSAEHRCQEMKKNEQFSALHCQWIVKKTVAIFTYTCILQYVNVIGITEGLLG